MKNKIDDKKLSLIKAAFAFLFKAPLNYSVTLCKTGPWGNHYLLTNHTTMVAISFEYDYMKIFVTVSKIEEGNLIDSEVIKSKVTLDLDNFMFFKYPDEYLKQDQTQESFFDVKEIKRVLNYYANVLQKYTASTLTGDFTIVSEIDIYVKNRIKKGDP